MVFESVLHPVSLSLMNGNSHVDLLILSTTSWVRIAHNEEASVESIAVFGDLIPKITPNRLQSSVVKPTLSLIASIGAAVWMLITILAQNSLEF